eukprot:scaffold82561_cov57-Phaeocystis_antarctica.AAC.3
MVTDLGAIAAADAIHAHTAKFHIGDTKRVAAAIEWYEPRIDFDKLLASGLISPLCLHTGFHRRALKSPVLRHMAHGARAHNWRSFFPIPGWWVDRERFRNRD